MKKILLLIYILVTTQIQANDYIQYFNQAEKASKENRYDQAIDLYFKAINLTPKSKVKDYNLILNNLAVTYMKIGDKQLQSESYQKALFNYKESLRILDKSTDKKNNNIVVAKDNIAFTYRQMGLKSKDLDEALRYYKKALPRYRKSSTTGIEKQLVFLLNDIGTVYSYKKEFKKAKKFLEESLDKSIKEFGAKSKESATVYYNLGYMYEMSKKGSKAFSYYDRALKIRESVLGVMNPDTAMSYKKIGYLYYAKGNYDKALEHFKVALRATEKGSGIDNENALDTYSFMGNIYEDKGMLDKAKNYHEMSLEIRQNLYGLNHLGTALGYNNMANIYYKMNKYSKALDFHDKAIDIKKSNPKATEIDLAYSINGKANVYSALDNQTEAIKFFKIALKTFKKELGFYHRDTATVYSNLALSYISLNNFKDAKKCNSEALKIRNKLFNNKPHPNIAMNHNTFGLIYDNLGDNKKAIEEYKNALNMKKALGQTEDESIATIYHNMALIYQKLSSSKEALSYLEKAKNILEKLDFEHPSLESIYDSLGYLYGQMGDKQKQLQYQKKVLELRKKVYGLNHSSVAISYNSIGDILIDNSDYRKTLRYYQNALDIGKKTFGLNHPFTARCYSNIAFIKLTQKRYREARRGYQNAYEIYENNFGKNHPSLIDSYINLGLVSSYLNDFDKYYKFNKEAFELYQEYRMDNFSLLDSKQKLNYSKSNRYYISSLFHSATEYKKSLKKKSYKSVDSFVLDSWLNYKRSIFDIENSLNIIAQKNTNPKVKKQIEKLNSTQRELAKLYQESGNYKDIKKYKQNIESLKQTLSKLQKKLSVTVEEYRDELNLKDITYKDIAKRLEPKELYLDFAKVGDLYYYFLLDKKQNITFNRFDRPTSTEIDKIIKEIQKETTKIINGTTFANIALAKKQYGKLYNLIFKKINMQKIDSLIVSPDGLLNLLPFEAFYNTKEKKYLVESLNIRYIPSGKEFVRLYQNSNKSSKNIVVFANPNFGLKIPSSKSRRGTIDALYHQAKSLNRVNALFSPLAGTIDEADNINRLFREDTKRYMGDKATEVNFFNIKSPKILHLSTHGFFIKDKKVINPLLKSGIALSGANQAVKLRTGDGIITGLELAGINLNGTELVVLSACETGIGEIEEAEGVAGINKAFMRAGAKHIVMSLWSVSDKATANLMKKFYENIEDGKNYSKALSEAKIFMIKNKNSHPYFWSGFVGSGKN